MPSGKTDGYRSSSIHQDEKNVRLWTRNRCRSTITLGEAVVTR